MSNTRVKVMAAVSTDELENDINDFISQSDVEVKNIGYQTDGYEKPYSALILYHEKDGKKIPWKDRVKWMRGGE